MNNPPKGHIQKLAGTNKIVKPINLTGIDKVHLKFDFINGSTVSGVSEPILFNFALDKPPGHEEVQGTKNQTFQKDKKSVLYRHIFLEDNDDKPVDFIGEMITFTCQLVKT